MIRKILPLYTAALCCAVLSAPALAEESAQVCGETYDSVEAAQEIIRNRDDVAFNGSNAEYVAFASETEQKIWTFTTNNNRAHPALVCRQVVYQNNAASIRTTSLCEADEIQCDWLLMKFEALNDTVKEDLQKDLDEMKKNKQAE